MLFDWQRSARIQWELDELRREGIRFDAPATTEGAFTLAVYVTIHGEQHRLEVDFPELYPYFRFEIRAPSLSLPHHQHPFGKTLCVMPRGTQHWRIRYSLAASLREQLPKVLDAGKATNHNTVAAVEEHQAEPVTTYYDSYPGAMILIDSAWQLPDDFTTGQISVACDVREKSTDPVHGAVIEIRTQDGRPLFTAPDHLRRDGQVLHGSIVKLKRPRLEGNAANFAASLRSEFHLPFHGRTGLIAVVMPEEHRWRDDTGQGWLFIISDKNRNASYYARAGRAGASDLRARAPELSGFEEHTITVFGLGCVGSTSAIELAKAGAKELRLVDHDYIDPGTVLRWHEGLPVAGLLKANVIAASINQHFPLTSAVPYVYRVGANGASILDVITNDATLLYDATAEDGVSYFLAELARHRNIPYVHVSARQGGWGGVVVRLTKDTGCWYCLEVARTARRIPPPPADTAGDVQPVGCSDPTFKGTGFDVSTIALAGVRTAVSTLPTRYPSQPWDVMTITLRDAEGNLIPPRCDTFTLPKDSACPVCGSL
jgi:ThiF family